ncbi:hypothetical protein TOPH_03255 [Tolypocladium ophioglossoides CBS 100239]|uniref:DUF1941 family protein n=1 Tax=Tolypocladium ophioglossoides (strain CBS 100239) TaxID=1163406 RepID=A0A0L0NE76_TOLOC|nr:hypothetical protein TOPH_03255 [Tolypocladium ophioglossoides CBS 100239]
MEPSTTAAAQTSSDAPPSDEAVNLTKIRQLLKAKDDTQRFVGLALLKSVLDNSQQLRENEQVVQSLWDSLPSKFLDRLLRTGSKPSNQNAKEMLDLVVSVLYTFAALLPEQSRGDAKFADRIPGLVGTVLYSSEETTALVLQLLHTLVSSPNGAQALVRVEDLSPLTETAPTHAIVLDILRFSWLNAMTVVEDKRALSLRIDDGIRSLVSSFTGTDAVTLLEFLGSFLRQADSAILSPQPKWLKTVVGYVQNLVTSRPTPEARSAYTNVAASLLQAYPSSVPELLFTDEKRDEKPFAYLLINLLLIDIRSSAPRLLEQLNTPEYPKTSRRLASAFDVICIFIGYLVRSLEDESLETLIMPPDSLFKIRKSISETISVAVEYLRDRWDASVAGAMGLHPDARVATAETASGSHRTLAWDAIANTADNDPYILSAVRALALWLREEENELLRKEATGLIDMFMDLYRASTAEKLDFRSAILVALEALITLDQGCELLLRHDGWQILSDDLTGILQESSTAGHEGEASRGIEVVRVLLQVAEQEYSGTQEDWMNLITTVAAWHVSGQELPPVVQEFQVAVLQLCCTLLAGANGGARSRYRYSISAINGIANRLSRSIGRDSFVREPMEDVLATLDGFVRVG